MNLLKRFVGDDQGQDLIEYALLLGIIAVGVTVTLQSIGDRVATKFEAIDTALTPAG